MAAAQHKSHSSEKKNFIFTSFRKGSEKDVYSTTKDVERKQRQMDLNMDQS